MSNPVAPPSGGKASAAPRAAPPGERSRAAFEDALARRREPPVAADADSAPLLPALPLAPIQPFAPRSVELPAAPATARPAAAALHEALAAQAAANPGAALMDAALAATPADGAGRWHVELNQAQGPVRTLDFARGAEGQWQVTLHATPLVTADIPPEAALQRLRERLAARGASLNTRTTPFDDPDREHET